MTRNLYLIFMIIILAGLICGCGDDDDDDSSPWADDDDDDDDTADDDDDNMPDYPFCEIESDKVETILTGMTLREKIAQMYVVGVQIFPWFDFGDAERFIKDIGVGGVFLQPMTGVGLFPSWTVDNTNKLQNWAMSRTNSVPLIITCDQEGGIPQAVSNVTGGTDTPGNMGLGATFNPDLSFEAYNLMGSQLHALGINNAYSPVTELMISPEESSMYTRCFGEDTGDVAAHSAMAVEGFQMNLIIATAKHFPSHSTASGDEHHEMPVNLESQEAVREKYFPPFQASVDAGVDMIMTTHANYSSWEPTLPTTFSKILISDILRNELGYQGLIVTDDMNMGSITNQPWTEHPHILAIISGHDLILDTGGDSEAMYGMHPANEKWAIDLEGQIDAIAQAVIDGTVYESDINDSVRRILSTKMKYCLFENPYRNPDNIFVNTPQQIETANQLHQQAVTLVRNDQGLIPLDADGEDKIHVVSIGPIQSVMYPGAFWPNLSGTSLLTQVRAIYPEATGDLFDVKPSQRVINRIVQNTIDADSDILIIGTYHDYYHIEQQALVNGLLELDIPTVMVALALPYDLLAHPNIQTYLATYSNRDLAIKAAAGALFGNFEPGGKLPVALPGMYEYGHNAMGN